MKIRALSPSGYACYAWCPFQYYLKYILKFTEGDQSGPSALLGQIAHKVLELLSRAKIGNKPISSKVWDYNYLWNIVFNHYSKKNPETAGKIDKSKLKNVCKKLVELINHPVESPLVCNTLSSEQSFGIELKYPEFITPKEWLHPNETGTKYFSIRGIIDRIDKLDGETIEIVDYKTGQSSSFLSQDKKKKEPSDLKKEVQPGMYFLASKTLYPWAKNVLTTFNYITDGGPISVPYCDADLPDILKMIRTQYNLIKNDNNPQRNRTWRCKNFCPFGNKTGICNRIWAEKEELGHQFIENQYKVLNIKTNYRK